MFCRKRSEKTLYLDHGATTYPHPPCVLHAMEQCMDFHGGNPGRGSHKLAEKAAEEMNTMMQPMIMMLTRFILCRNGSYSQKTPQKDSILRWRVYCPTGITYFSMIWHTMRPTAHCTISPRAAM